MSKIGQTGASPERRQAGEVSGAEIDHSGLGLGIHQLVGSGDVVESHEVPELVQHDGPDDPVTARALEDAGQLSGIQLHCADDVCGWLAGETGAGAAAFTCHVSGKVGVFIRGDP